MVQGLLAQRQGGSPLPEIVAGNDGTIGRNFSKRVVPLRSLGGGTCSWASSLAGGRCSGPQGSFCIIQPAFYGRVRGYHEEQGLGIGQAQTRPCAHDLGWELLKPAPD